MKILGLSGKKQSGKNTSVNYLFGLELTCGTYNFKGQVIDVESFRIDEKGKLLVPVEHEGVIKESMLDLENPTDTLREFLALNIAPFLKCYSFADKLKQMCIHIFGLEYSQCYGSDDDKNTFTLYSWKAMPKELQRKFWGKADSSPDRNITAREFLQLIGTQVFRWIHGDVWVESCIRQITIEQPELAIIPDVRFPNEVYGLQKAGGKVIRLTRHVKEDSHESETALDDFTDWDAVIDNQNMTITEQNNEVFRVLKEWDYLPYPINTKLEEILNDCLLPTQ